MRRVALAGLAALAWLALGCGEEPEPRPESPPSRARGGGRRSRESQLPPSIDYDDVRFSAEGARRDLRFQVTAPAWVTPGQAMPVVVRVVGRSGRTEPSASGWVRLVAGDGAVIDDAEVLLRRGVGSVTTRVESDRSFELRVVPALDRAGRSIGISRRPAQRLGGRLEAREHRWPPGSLIEITADLTLPAGGVLVIERGSNVRIGPRVNLLLEGDLEVRGAVHAPVVFTPIPGQEAWGGIVHFGRGRYSHALLVGGGADTTRRYGHSKSQALIFAEPGAEVVLESSAIQDAVGKGIGGRLAVVRLFRTLIARTDMGAELIRCATLVEEGHFLDFPDLGAPFRDDDNDAFYVAGALTREGAEVPTVIRDSVFIGGVDDGIDLNGGMVEIHRSWIHGFSHEGVAAAGPARVFVRDTAISGCEQALEAGAGSPRVVADHVLLFANEVGGRYGDAYRSRYAGALEIGSSVLVDNRRQGLRNWLHSTGAPAPAGIELRHSLVEERSWDRGEGNVVGRARLDALLLLAADSPGRGIAADGSDPGLLTGRPR